MKHLLVYGRTRQLFAGSNFKPFVNKYFKDVEYLGAQDGQYGYHATISISNWQEVKGILPKYAIPEYDYPATKENLKLHKA